MTLNIPPHLRPQAQPPLQPSANSLRGWRVLLALLLCTVTWLAFSPHPPPQADTGWDKLNHTLAFAVLACCACFAFAGSRRRFVVVPLALIAYGLFIEGVQTQIPGRYGEWPDVLADGLGVLAGLLLVALHSHFLRAVPHWLRF